MTRLPGILILAGCALLAGCASTMTSDVTSFHVWPADLKNKSFLFAPTKEQENNLEYRNYEQLIRTELLRLGFTDASPAVTVALKVAFSYGIWSGTVIMTQPLYDPFWRRRPFGPWGPGPFYDPFWHPAVQTAVFPVFQRRLSLSISQAGDDRKLYEVTVDSEGREASLPAAMPYMVHSAFSDFPGPNGVTRHVVSKLEQPAPARSPEPGRPKTSLPLRESK